MSTPRTEAVILPLMTPDLTYREIQIYKLAIQLESELNEANELLRRVKKEVVIALGSL